MPNIVGSYLNDLVKEFNIPGILAEDAIERVLKASRKGTTSFIKAILKEVNYAGEKALYNFISIFTDRYRKVADKAVKIATERKNGTSDLLQINNFVNIRTYIMSCLERHCVIFLFDGEQKCAAKLSETLEKFLSKKTFSQTSLLWFTTKLTAWSLEPQSKEWEDATDKVVMKLAMNLYDESIAITQSEKFAEWSNTKLLYEGAYFDNPTLIYIAKNNGESVNKDIGNILQAGYSAIHWAAFQGSCKAIETLVACGADVDIVNTIGLAPLHIAVYQLSNQPEKMYKTVETLLNVGASFNKKGIGTSFGWTPSQYAIYYCSDSEYFGKSLDLFLKQAEKELGLGNPKFRDYLDEMISFVEEHNISPNILKNFKEKVNTAYDKSNDESLRCKKQRMREKEEKLNQKKNKDDEEQESLFSFRSINTFLTDTFWKSSTNNNEKDKSDEHTVYQRKPGQ